MNRPHVCSLVSGAVDGALDPEERVLFDEHLDRCTDCQREMRAVQETKWFLKGAPRRSAPPELVSRLRKQYTSVRPWRRWVGWAFPVPRWVFSGALATLVVGVAFGLWNLWGPGRDQSQHMELAPLLARHARSSSDGWIPAGDYYNAGYSAQLASYEDESFR